MSIEIEIPSRSLFDLFDKEILGDAVREAPGGVLIRYLGPERGEQSWSHYRAFDGEPSIRLQVEFASVGKEVGAGAFAAWLCEKLKRKDGRAMSIRINQTQVELRPEAITKALEE
jgi:hypothetical protein